MEDGFVRFVDRTTNPDFAEELSAVSLTAEGLGTRPSRHAKVALRDDVRLRHPAVRPGRGRRLHADRTSSTSRSSITDYPVPRLNPYMDHLLAWVAKDGTLTATLHYRLSGDDLQADNDVTLRGARPRASRRRAARSSSASACRSTRW